MALRIFHKPKIEQSSPITHYEIPRPRRSKIEGFKEKLVHLQESFARIQKELLSIVKNDPDDYIGLRDRAEELILQYKLGSIFGHRIRERIRRYIDKRNEVRRLREQYPDNTELYKRFFGQSPKGKIEVIEGAVNLHFRCHDPRDFALAYGGEPINVNAFFMPGSAFMPSYLPEGMGIITVENAQGIGTTTYKHEEQHAFYDLLKFGYSPTDPEDLNKIMSEIMEAETVEQKKLYVKRYLRELRKNSEDQAKNELLAYYFKSKREPEKILKILTEDDDYNYFSDLEEIQPSFWVNKLDKNFYDSAEKAVKEIFETEYHKLIKDGLRACQDLEKEYSEEQAIAILTYEPLRKWKKVVKRLFEVKQRGLKKRLLSVLNLLIKKK